MKKYKVDARVGRAYEKETERESVCVWGGTCHQNRNALES